MTHRQDAAKGIRWTAFSLLLVSATELIRLVVLGHILVPETFGLMAMMLVVTGLGQMIGQAGLSEAIIQHPNPTHVELSSLFWLNIFAGGLLYIILLIFTPLISVLYSSPQIQQLLPWLALSFLILPWGAQIKALLQKRLWFKPIAIIEILSASIGMLVAITLALKGYDIWSLVTGALARSTVMSISLVVVAWRLELLPDFEFSFKATKPYVPFGLNLLGSNLLNYFNARVDQLVIGVFLGPQALGYYSMAFNLVLQPVSQINPVLTQVAFPLLAQIRSDKLKLKHGYFRMLDILTSFNAPVLIGIATVAPLLIPILLGDKWLPIVPLIQVLAIFSLIRSIANAGGSLVMACGRADLALYWNLILFVVIPITIYFGAVTNGLQGVAWTLLGLQLSLIFIWYYFIVEKLLGESFQEYILSIVKPIILATLMTIPVIGVRPLLWLLPNFAQLIIQVLIGAIFYIILSIAFRRNFVLNQLKLFFNR